MGEEEFTTKKIRCAMCKYYIFIDSGYGYCRRFPPKINYIRKGFKKLGKIEYQIVEWCRRACGEYIHKYLNQVKGK